MLKLLHSYDAIRWTWTAGYNVVSGPFADIPMLGILIVLYRKHVCHVKWCPRIQWKAHGDHVLCRKHHPQNPPKADDVGTRVSSGL